jgi:hypothetical protein
VRVVAEHRHKHKVFNAGRMGLPQQVHIALELNRHDGSLLEKRTHANTADHAVGAVAGAGKCVGFADVNLENLRAHGSNGFLEPGSTPRLLLWYQGADLDFFFFKKKIIIITNKINNKKNNTIIISKIKIINKKFEGKKKKKKKKKYKYKYKY